MRGCTAPERASCHGSGSPKSSASCWRRCKQARYPAPQAAWLWAFAEMRKRRDAGSLTLPLKGHGYLYEVLSRWEAQDATTTVMAPATAPVVSGGKPASKTLSGIAALEGLKR